MYFWIFIIALLSQNVFFIPNITNTILLCVVYHIAQIFSSSHNKNIYYFPILLAFIVGFLIKNIWIQCLATFLWGNYDATKENVQFSPEKYLADYMNHYVLGIVSMVLILNATSEIPSQICFLGIMASLTLSFQRQLQTSFSFVIILGSLTFLGWSFFPTWSIVIPIIGFAFTARSIPCRLVFLLTMLYFQLSTEVNGILQFIMLFLPFAFSILFLETSQITNDISTFFKSRIVPTYILFLTFFLLFTPIDPKMSFLVNSEKNPEIQFHHSNRKLVSTSSFDTLQRQAGLLINTFLPKQSMVVIRGDWFLHVSSAFIDDHVIFYQVPDRKITKKISEDLPMTKTIFSHINFHVQDTLPQIPSYDIDLIFDVIHTDRVFSNPFVRNSFQQSWMKQFQLSEDGLYVALIHLPSIENISCLIFDLQSTFDHHQIWFLPNSFDAVVFVGSSKPLDAFFQSSSLPNTQQSSISSKQRISIFKHLAFTQSIAKPKSCPLWIWKEPNHISYPILDLLLYTDVFPDVTYLPQDEQYAIQLQRNDILMNLKAWEASKQGNIQKAFAIASQSKDSTMLINPHIHNAKIGIEKAKREGMDSSNWSEALRHAQTAYMLSPSAVEPKILLAEIAIGQGFPSKAKEWYTQILEKEPENIESIDGMARVAGLENKPEDVENWLLQGFQKQPEDPKRSHNLGYFYLQRRQFDAADSYLRTSLQKNPDSIETQLALSELYLLREEYARARITIDRIHQTNKSGLSWFLRGRAHFGLMEYASAEEDFRRAILADPKMDNARGAIGNCRIALGDLEGAAQAYRSALQFNPNNKAAKDNLVKVEQELSRISTELQENP